MWFHNSRSISKRERRCTISFLNFGYTQLLYNGDVNLPNEETEINIKKLLEKTRIDCNNAFNYKLSGLQANIFTLPIKDSQDNTSIYIGLQEIQIDKNILCITKDNIIKNYLLLPYFKVNKDNLEEGKYINKHTQISYHLGLFEIQIQDKTLKSAILVETISIKDKITLNEFFNEFSYLKFYPQEYVYSVVGLSSRAYFLKHKLTNSVYLFNFSDITNPKIGNIFGDKDHVKQIWYKGRKVSYFSYNKGRGFFQIRGDDKEYLVKDNCNGKYEKIKRLKENDFYSNKGMLLYDKQNHPYFPHETNYAGELKKGYTDIKLSYIVGDSDLNKLPFAKTRNRYLIFQFTPFNNLNLIYYHDYIGGKKLYEYSIIPENKSFKNIFKLNSKTITNKYKIHEHYKNPYHRYLYYVDNEYRVPYVQVWGDKSTNQVYGCILNMKGKWSVFDKEIIEEK